MEEVEIEFEADFELNDDNIECLFGTYGAKMISLNNIIIDLSFEEIDGENIDIIVNMASYFE